MVRLELQIDEAETLLGLLQDSLSDLRMEAADTEGYEYQIAVKQREAVLKNILTNLEAQTGARAAS